MDKALGYLALAAKAGALAVGAEESAKRLRRGKGCLLVLASDAGESAAAQAVKLTEGRADALCRVGYTKQEIARAIGRGKPVALVLICEENLAGVFRASAHKD